MNNHWYIFLRRFAFLLLPAALYACAPAPQQPAKETKEAKKPARYKPTPNAPYYDVDNYVKQLSLAKLALENAPDDADAVKAHLSVVRDFAGERQSGSIYQPAVIISYRLKNKKDLEQVVAPFAMSEDSPGFPDLVDITTQLDTTKYTLQDVRPIVITRLPDGNLNPPQGTLAETRHAIEKQLKALLASKSELADIDAADVQLRLIQFFMQHHARDAAYLSAENAQNSLAEAQDNGRDPDIINALSDQLDALNGELHRQMPFTLNAL